MAVADHFFHTAVTKKSYTTAVLIIAEQDDVITHEQQQRMFSVTAGVFVQG